MPHQQTEPLIQMVDFPAEASTSQLAAKTLSQASLTQQVRVVGKGPLPLRKPVQLR